MMDRGGHVRLLPSALEPATGDSEEWVEEIPESEIPPNDYQQRLAKLSAAEDAFYEDLASSASDGEAPVN